MISAQDAISHIYTVAKLIYDQVQKVKANKKQCETLAKRVKAVAVAIQDLERVLDQDHYTPGLINLYESVKECHEFVKKFSESNKWFRYVLKTGTYQDTFAGLNDKLQKY